jgi:hypothetical protein
VFTSPLTGVHIAGTAFTTKNHLNVAESTNETRTKISICFLKACEQVGEHTPSRSYTFSQHLLQNKNE